MKKYIALLLAFAMMLTLCACGGEAGAESAAQTRKDVNCGLYIKDSELFFSDLEQEPWQLSSRLVDDEEVKDADLAYYGSRLACYTQVSADGALIFYPDKFSSGDEGVNLYFRKANTEEEGTKIDSDVTRYHVNADASLVTYTKGLGEDCNLYQYAVKEEMKEKIASGVMGYAVSEDGSKILYINGDGNLYLQQGAEEKEKIATDITSLVYQSEDFTTVYYIKDEALYSQTVGADREKIDSDIYKVIQTYDSGEMYYLKRGEETATLMDYVVDDMKAVDEAAPTDYPYKPYRYSYDTTAEYEAAYAEYEAAYDAYYAAYARNNWRAYLAETELNHSIYALHFYNGAETAVVTESFAGESEYRAAAEAAVISYVAYNQESVAKVKLSELVESDDADAFQEKIEAALFSDSDRYITLGGTAAVLEQENAKAVRINEPGTEIYYVDDVPEEKTAGDLYRVAIAEGVVGEPELYDSDVYTGYGVFLTDSQFLYFKDYKEGKGDLYLNKAKIDYDVSSLYVNYDAASDSVYYFTDWESEKEYGILKKYANAEAVKIADDVHDYTYISDGKVLYLYDYSLKYYAGELHLWANGESTKVDDDVIYMIPADLEREAFQQLYSAMYAAGWDAEDIYEYAPAAATEALAAAWW